jgi:quercetin dioxygenase-like cupin family protein
MAESRSLVAASELFTIEPLPGATVGLLTGADHGLGLSLIFGNFPPGTGPEAHRHSRGSAICVIEGRGMFTVNGEELLAEAGDVVIVPAQAWHTFTNVGDGMLRTIAADEGERHDLEFPETSAS